jgi:hypothetical protein
MFGILLAPKSRLACDRQALSATQRERHFNVLVPYLRSRIQGVKELEDGYEFEFTGDLAALALAADWADGEHLCCPFFEIDLKLEAGAVWLRLTGPEGAKELIRSELC